MKIRQTFRHYGTFFQVVIGHVLPLLLPSIMNCLLSKLEELLTNKYSGLISDQQNNKWRRWNNTLQQSQGKALNPRILMITKLYLKLCNVIKTSNHYHGKHVGFQSQIISTKHFQYYVCISSCPLIPMHQVCKYRCKRELIAVIS